MVGEGRGPAEVPPLPGRGPAAARSRSCRCPVEVPPLPGRGPAAARSTSSLRARVDGRAMGEGGGSRVVCCVTCCVACDVLRDVLRGV